MIFKMSEISLAQMCYLVEGGLKIDVWQVSSHVYYEAIMNFDMLGKQLLKRPFEPSSTYLSLCSTILI